MNQSLWPGLLHDLLLLGRVALFHQFLEHLQRKPRDKGQNRNLKQELSIDVADLDVLTEYYDTGDVNHKCQQNRYDHHLSDLCHFRQNVEHFDANQSCERDSNDVDERLVKLDYCNEHDPSGLIDRLPSPNQECFQVKGAALLNSLVESRESVDLLVGDIFVEDEREYGEHGVDSRVAQK